MPKVLIGNVVGPAGADGIGIKNITFKEEQADGNVYTITLTNDSTHDIKAPKGSQGPTGAKGEDGQAGATGPQGVSIESIVFKETNADGGNVYTITLTNKNTYEFTAPRGQQGIPGQQGPAGSTDYNNLENKPDLTVYQSKTVSTLPTTAKTIEGAISELNTGLSGKLGKTEKAPSAGTADTAKACSGNSATATKLATARQINGVNFDGTANITIKDSTKLATTGGTISGNLTVTGAIVANGNVTAYSDRRLKTDIVKITNALDKVNQINGYTFTMLGIGQRQAGVIAQEIEKVLPEAIVQNENGYLSVDYGRIVGLLIEGIKDLKIMIEDLKQEIDELKGGK